MLFDIWLWSWIIVPIIVPSIVWAIFVNDKFLNAAGSFFLSVVILLGMSMPFFFTYSDYVSACATIAEQSQYVKIQKQKRDRLTQLLKDFKYPQQNQFTVTVNHDTPVASIVKELTNVENDLARSQSWIADAYRTKTRIEMGWMSGVAKYVSCNIKDTQK